MEKFDKYAGSYETLHEENIRITGFSPSYFDEFKVRAVYDYLKSLSREAKVLNFLNFGCGIGKSEVFIKRYLPNSKVFSIDVSGESIEAAKKRNNRLQNVFFEVFDGQSIPFDKKFDVIFAANVFHHIDFEKHLSILKNLHECLGNCGALFLFEHNPLNPLTRYAVKTCEFDQDARLLNPVYTGRILSASGFVWKRLQFTIFFPKFLSSLIPLEKYLRYVPFGAQYYYVAGKGEYKTS